MISQAIVVTGGSGFIGSNFIRQWLTKEQTHIVNLDKLTYAGNQDSLTDVANNPSYEFIHGSINDTALVTSILETIKPRAVINFAAESHVDRSIDNPEAFVQTNVVGTFKLLESVKHYWANLDTDQSIFRFLHVSTDEVYGSLGASGKFTETTPYAPNSPYSASKASSDHFVRAYYHTYKLPTLITNCSNNYGPYQFPEKLIPLIILNALERKPLPVYGDGRQVRDWIYVDDHCDALRTVLAKGEPGDTYNIGGNCEQENIDIIRMICLLVDEFAPGFGQSRSGLITYVMDRPGHDKRYAIDATKIKSTIGWEPSTEFHAGLRKTVQWYLNNTEWVDRITTGKYRRNRLGLGK